MQWTGFIKNTIAKVAPDFTMKRMLVDYQKKFYRKLAERTRILSEKQYSGAKTIAAWKREIEREWSGFEVQSIDFENPPGSAFNLGNEYSGSVVIDLKDLPASSIGLELVVAGNGKEGQQKVMFRQEFKMDKVEDGKAWFSIKVTPKKSGSFTYGIRIFPKHELLPYRQDIRCLSWI